MLAQQREIQLKKRQSSLAGGIFIIYISCLTSIIFNPNTSILLTIVDVYSNVSYYIGMVRSSYDSVSSSPLNKSVDKQFTPALRQFSAPKSAVRDVSLE